MPLYEYRCEQCAKVFEVIQKFSDEPLKACETCGSPVEKLMSRTSFQLKGSGWYASDYKKPTASTTTSSSPTSPAPSASTPVASESKPAPKADSCGASHGSCKK